MFFSRRSVHARGGGSGLICWLAGRHSVMDSTQPDTQIQGGRGRGRRYVSYVYVVIIWAGHIISHRSILHGARVNI